MSQDRQGCLCHEGKLSARANSTRPEPGPQAMSYFCVRGFMAPNAPVPGASLLASLATLQSSDRSRTSHAHTKNLHLSVAPCWRQRFLRFGPQGRI